MRNLILFCFVLLFSAAQAQTTIYSENFDSLNVGDFISVAGNSSYWTTWSGTKGGADDAKISNTQFISDSNALKLIASDDIVLLLGDKTSGRYKINFNVFIETDKIGYLSIMQDFAGTDSKRALQLFFYNTDTLYIDGMDNGLSKTLYNQNEWLDLSFIIDLDDDFATFFFNDTEMLSWQWSNGDSTLLQLGGINLYGLTTGGTAGFYVDDIEFIEELPAKTGPTDLVSTEVVGTDGSDFKFTWIAPAEAPSHYIFSKDGSTLSNTITTAVYTDEKVYPNTYEYIVRAYYDGFGYSAGATKSVTLAGGIQRAYSVVEVATGTWCYYCPGAAMAVDEMHEDGEKIAIVEYHSGDNYDHADATTRIQYYGVTGFPSGIFDGRELQSGGSNTSSLIGSYKPKFEKRMNTPSLFKVDLSGKISSTNIYNVKVDVEELAAYYEGDMTLHIVLTESHIEESWFAMNDVNFVMRKMFPDAAGTMISLDAEGKQTVETTFVLGDTINALNSQVVVFVQHEETKEIVEAAIKDLSDFEPSSIHETIELNANVYPNPVQNTLKIEGEEVEHVKVFDMKGMLFYDSKFIGKQNSISTVNWNAGTYLLELQGNLGTERLLLVKD